MPAFGTKKESVMVALRGSVCHAAMSAAMVGVLGLAVIGCGQPPSLRSDVDVARPRPRLGRYPTATLGGADFRGLDDLGEHSYKNTWGEYNGIVYTCQGGHIDIAHVRQGADAAAYVAHACLQAIERGDRHLSLDLSQPAQFILTFEPPRDWHRRSYAERSRTAREVAIVLGSYVSFVELTWHEILTWFGYRNILFYPEFPSAFSWEDSFSNLLGAHLGAVALRDTKHEFDRAMTLALRRELETLEIQSKETAARASERVRGHWYSGGFLFLVDMKRRNLDIGIDNGYITPWLVPGLAECTGATPRRYAVPRLDELSEFGFSARLEIEPRAAEEKELLEQIRQHRGPTIQRIEPDIDFPTIMEWIRRDAIERYGADALQPKREPPFTQLGQH